jgi:choline-sulfatase
VNGEFSPQRNGVNGDILFGENQRDLRFLRSSVVTVFSVVFVIFVSSLLAGCGRGAPEPSPDVPPERPSILLVTLDTTRYDAIGPEAEGIETPAFNALAARGLRFRQAYATAPETLPSHGSMMTGLYPGGHGIHENGRFLARHHPVLAEQLQDAGYRTAAFVSAFVLAHRFGLARGFDTYDDEIDGVERSARETTERALAYLERGGGGPLLLWVHYFDPHTPYEPPEPFAARFAATPYLGEVAAMDEQLGRLVDAFERRAPGPTAVIVVSDHGEGLGDHGESQHGNLAYQSTMHVPMVIAGPGVTAGASDTPVSIRRVFHTVLDWAGLGSDDSLRGVSTDVAPGGSGTTEVVLGEAMKPFLSYGWQPQIMAVDGRHKAIYAGRLEIYDVVADPGETNDLYGSVELSDRLRSALEDYPVPSLEAAAAPQALSEDAQRQLAALGYVSATAPPVIREDAPRPIDMVHLFDTIERASTLFVQRRYAQVIPLLETILESDPHNLDAALRLASAHSHLGNDSDAVRAFDRAGKIAPKSPDVRLYRALHDARGRDWSRAAPVLERVVEQTPDRLAAVEGLAFVRERQGRIEDAVNLWQRVHRLREPSATEAARLGLMAMSIGQTPAAIESLERARTLDGPDFRHDLELGVLYLDARRLTDARDALDRVPAAHPEYPMALFKRAQVSVLLDEPDRANRVAQARKHADATTRPLIAREKLFR